MRVGLIGASGYAGLELLRILLRHPRLEVAAVTSEQRAGQRVGEAFPAFRGLVDLSFVSADPAVLASRVDVAFTALPHAASAPIVRELRKAGVRVLDLSADFRLRDLGTYEAWYGSHPAPELVSGAVYGMPELYREALPDADLVAVPGCYPTAALLPLAPFLRAGWCADASIVVDAKSGVSGAGRKLDAGFLMAEMDGECRAYNVGKHRHAPEIEQEASVLAGDSVGVLFVPHLLPTVRGIISTAYVKLAGKRSSQEARALLEAAYEDEEFVRVLPEGATPALSAVRGSNFCDVNALVDERSGNLVVLSAIDNLIKGAGGQAVQCLNATQGWNETEGLTEAPHIL